MSYCLCDIAKSIKKNYNYNVYGITNKNNVAVIKDTFVKDVGSSKTQVTYTGIESSPKLFVVYMEDSVSVQSPALRSTFSTFSESYSTNVEGWGFTNQLQAHSGNQTKTYSLNIGEGLKVDDSKLCVDVSKMEQKIQHTTATSSYMDYQKQEYKYTYTTANLDYVITGSLPLAPVDGKLYIIG